jgi:NAD(P)-dependent dehydrogenase (short-subunit alcohol dehydrogenase family)
VQTAIITGATGGLGLQCARSLLGRDPAWHVVLAVRDVARGAEAVRGLGRPDRCTVMELELASLASVERFLGAYRAAGLPPTGAVICNAGTQVVSGVRFTEDGFEATFATNHLGHFALVHGLLGDLAPAARIVVVSSDTHDPARRTGMPAPRYTTADALADPPAAERHDSARAGRRRYTTSKLCNVLFAYELHRRLAADPRGITVIAFNPGLMPGSGLAREYSKPQQLVWRHVLPALRFLPQVRSTAESGRDLAALAADPRFASAGGTYVDGRKPTASSVDSRDPAKALDLWETSVRLISVGGR